MTAEFDPYIFLSWFIPSTVSAVIGAFLFVTKSSWRKGKVEAKAEGETTLNQTMVTNAIREIEVIKVDLRNLVVELQNQKIASTRIEERIKFMSETLENIRTDIKGVSNHIRSSNSESSQNPFRRNRNLYDDEMNDQQQ